MITSLGARIRARLIPDLRVAPKLWSIRIMAAGSALLALWPEIPLEIRAQLPWANQIGAGVLIASLLARLLKQKDVGE